jgi:hypothetical protein
MGPQFCWSPLWGSLSGLRKPAPHYGDHGARHQAIMMSMYAAMMRTFTVMVASSSPVLSGAKRSGTWVVKPYHQFEKRRSKGCCAWLPFLHTCT